MPFPDKSQHIKDGVWPAMLALNARGQSWSVCFLEKTEFNVTWTVVPPFHRPGDIFIQFGINLLPEFGRNFQSLQPAFESSTRSRQGPLPRKTSRLQLKLAK